MLFLVSSLFAASVDVYEGDDLSVLTSSLNPGDEIRLHKGTYPISENGLRWTGLGTESQPITIRGVEDGVVLQMSSGWVTVSLTDSAYFTIKNLTISGAEGWEAASYGGLREIGRAHV